MRKGRNQIIAIGAEPFEQGQEFDVWPLHITLVPWFKDAKQSKVSDGLEAISGYIKPFHVHLGEKALFGARNDIPVRLVKENDTLLNLHLKALTVVHDAKGQLDYGIVGYRYRPHMTERGSEIELLKIPIEQLALIDGLDNGQRRVTEVFELHGQYR